MAACIKEDRHQQPISVWHTSTATHRCGRFKFAPGCRSALQGILIGHPRAARTNPICHKQLDMAGYNKEHDQQHPISEWHTPTATHQCGTGRFKSYPGCRPARPMAAITITHPIHQHVTCKQLDMAGCSKEHDQHHPISVSHTPTTTHRCGRSVPSCSRSESMARGCGVVHAHEQRPRIV